MPGAALATWPFNWPSVWARAYLPWFQAMTVLPLCGVWARTRLWMGNKDDIVAAARKPFPEGLDAILLTTGGEAAEKALSTLRQGGRAAYPNGVAPIPKERAGIKVQSYSGEYAPPFE